MTFNTEELSLTMSIGVNIVKCPQLYFLGTHLLLLFFFCGNTLSSVLRDIPGSAEIEPQSASALPAALAPQDYLDLLAQGIGYDPHSLMHT